MLNFIRALRPRRTRTQPIWPIAARVLRMLESPSDARDSERLAAACVELLGPGKVAESISLVVPIAPPEVIDIVRTTVLQQDVHLPELLETMRVVLAEVTEGYWIAEQPLFFALVTADPRIAHEVVEALGLSIDNLAMTAVGPHFSQYLVNDRPLWVWAPKVVPAMKRNRIASQVTTFIFEQFGDRERAQLDRYCAVERLSWSHRVIYGHSGEIDLIELAPVEAGHPGEPSPRSGAKATGDP